MLYIMITLLGLFGVCPAIAQEAHLPETPLVSEVSGGYLKPGKIGGSLTMLIPKERDIRLMNTYGYTRLIGYNERYELVPDVLLSFEVRNEREYIFHLRKGHKWSDGHPFTAEDFRYYWEDVANNQELSPSGVPAIMVVEDEVATFKVIDAHTVSYSWSKPNPGFLSAIAAATPLYLYRPSHYLKQFHHKYTDQTKLAAQVKQAGLQSWAALHNGQDNMHKCDNVHLPTLDPFINTTPLPSQKFVFVKNPYFHRVDHQGIQLPYIEKIILEVVSSKLIPAKAGVGETDLQARGLSFKDITFLKEKERRTPIQVLLWPSGQGSHLAIYPNLTTNDPEWRTLLRQPKFRQALSIAIDRPLISETLFLGLAKPSNNSPLKGSPFYTKENAEKWIQYDVTLANQWLDELGLDKKNNQGIRLSKTGRPLSFVLETAGEGSDETDVLELVIKNWRALGVEMLIKPMQRDMLYNRIFSGETVFSVWPGLDTGMALNSMSPKEFVPTMQNQLQWPKWGQYFETKGEKGEAIDDKPVQTLMQHFEQWRFSQTPEEQIQAWQNIVNIWVENCFTIGTVSDVVQPIVHTQHLKNVPPQGVFAWDPGAHFGIYRIDRFWLDVK